MVTKSSKSVTVYRAAIFNNRNYEKSFYVGYLTTNVYRVLQIGGGDVGSKNLVPDDSLHSVIMYLDFSDLTTAIYINGVLDSSIIFSSGGITTFDLNLFRATDAVAITTNNGYKGLFAEAGVVNVAVHKDENHL